MLCCNVFATLEHMFYGDRMDAPAVSRTRDAGLLRRVRELGPGARAGALLDRIDVQALDSFDRVELLRAWDAQVAWTSARTAEALVGVSGPTPLVDLTDRDHGEVDELSVEGEVAAALRIAPRTARGRVASARFLATTGAPAAEMLRSGRWTVAHARAAEDELAGVPAGVAADVMADVVARCLPGEDGSPAQYLDETPGRLRSRVRRTVARVDQAAATERIRGRHRERSCTLTPEPDFRGQVSIRGPYPMVAWAYRQLDHWARRERERLRGLDPALRDDDQDTSLEALRADAFVAAARLLASTDDGGPAAEPTPDRGRTWSTAVVVVEAPTALGMADEPGFVPGYGWVPAPVARELLGGADRWRRFLTDGGRLVDAGRRDYRPGAALRRHVTARDLTCTFPGCAVPSADSDLDHVSNFDGANTTAANLRPTCRSHHRLKTFGRWRVSITDDTRAVWTAPSGHRHRQHADPYWDPDTEPWSFLQRCPRTPVEVTPWSHRPPSRT